MISVSICLLIWVLVGVFSDGRQTTSQRHRRKAKKEEEKTENNYLHLKKLPVNKSKDGHGDKTGRQAVWLAGRHTGTYFFPVQCRQIGEQSGASVRDQTNGQLDNLLGEEIIFVILVEREKYTHTYIQTQTEYGNHTQLTLC